MIAIAVVFLFGVATTVYLSLRSPEVKVPDVVGKDRYAAEKILADADLKFRVRATRPSNQTQPDTVVFQLPRAGEVVKTGQTVAMDVSRPTKEGESPETVTPEENTNDNRNASSSSGNENKPRKPKPKNTNENANGNTNGNANANSRRPANANSPANGNANARPANANTTGNVNVPRANVNRANTGNANLQPGGNDNKRPVVPRPTPVPNPTRTRPAP